MNHLIIESNARSNVKNFMWKTAIHWIGSSPFPSFVALKKGREDILVFK